MTMQAWLCERRCCQRVKRPGLSETTPGGDCLVQRCDREGEVIGTFV
jgi:hypothetical protein